MLYEISAQPSARFEDQFGEALARMTSALGLDYGLLTEVQGDTITIVASYTRPGARRAFEPGTSRPLALSYCSETVETTVPFAIDHAAASPYRDHAFYQDTRFESYIGVPVYLGDTLYGTLSFLGAEPKSPPFTADDADLLALLARWAGTALAREQADKQLEQSELLLAGVLIGSLDPIIVLDAVRDVEGAITDFTYLLANPAAAATYGMPAEEVIGAQLLEVLPGMRSAGVFDVFAHVAETGEPLRREVFYEADGFADWFDYTVSQLGDGVAVTFRNVTERKRTEDALRESEARFRELFESSPDAIFVETVEGVVLDVNPAACRLHDATRAWLIGRDFRELLPEYYREEAFAVFQAFASGPSEILESLSLSRDGRVIPVEVRTSSITYDGAPAVLLLVRDVTERQVAEQALRESEQRFKMAFRAAPVAVTISTLDEGRYVDVNDSFCALTGYGRFEIAGRTEADLHLLPHGEPPGLDLLRKGGRVRDAEFQIRRKDGEIRDVLVSAEPLELGGVPCVLGIGIDVTDRKRLEREVIEASEMERRRIGQDLHDELGQQLTGAAFLSQALSKKLAGSDNAEIAERLTVLINDALAETRDLARLLSPVDVQAEGLMDALQNLADQTERIFDISCLLETSGDVLVRDNVVATHLFRIAQEAVNNAVKHASPSEITISLTRSRDGLRLAVLDDGLGFDPGLLQRPSGLGLRTMRYRAALIGATLTVASTAGGTSLSVDLAPNPAQ